MTRWDVLREVLALGLLITGLLAEVIAVVFLLIYGPWWIALPVIAAGVFVGAAVLVGRWDPERTLAERAAEARPVEGPQPVAGTPDRPVRMPRLPTRDTL